MKTMSAIAIAIVALTGLSLAFSDNAPDRPPGVAADHWASINPTLGVVLIPDSVLSTDSPPPAGGARPGVAPAEGPKVVAGSADPDILIAPPSAAVRKIIEEGQPVRGYIMVKRGKLWRPLLVVAPTVNN